jgi:hypothetical protein
MRTHIPAWRPLTPPQWVRVGPRNPYALGRACMHAWRCAAVPRRNRGAHAFARLPRGCKLCALCSRNASSRTKTVRNGRGRRWRGLSHAKGQGHHRRASARARTGLAGRIRPNFFSIAFPLLTPAPSPRRTCSGAWQRRREGGKALPEHGNFPWRACAATRAAGRWRRRCEHTVPGKTGRGKWQGAGAGPGAAGGQRGTAWGRA